MYYAIDGWLPARRASTRAFAPRRRGDQKTGDSDNSGFLERSHHEGVKENIRLHHPRGPDNEQNARESVDDGSFGSVVGVYKDPFMADDAV